MEFNGTIFSIYNCSSRTSLTESLFSVIIEDLIVSSNSQEYIVLHATTSTWAKDKVKGFAFTLKVFFNLITTVIYFSCNAKFCSLFFLGRTTLIILLVFAA